MSVVYAIVGTILVILGAVIWKKQMVSVIAGYDKNKTKDSAGLAKWVGRNLAIAGVLWVIFAIILMVADNIPTALKMIVPIALILTICIITAVGCKRYEKAR